MRPSQEKFLLALARAAIPASGRLPGADQRTIQRFKRYLSSINPWTQRLYFQAIRIFQALVVAKNGRRFEKLTFEQQARLLQAWSQGALLPRYLLRILTLPIKVIHLNQPKIHELFGSGFAPQPIARTEPPAYMRQVCHLPDCDQDLELEAEVVVVGTGAGGAVVAKELAVQGHAVVMLEEGRYYQRADFAASQPEKLQKLYRSNAMLTAWGNPPIAIQLGKCVGGTTTINSGTCYRPSEQLLRNWREELGLTMFTPKHMEPYFRRVESVLQVTPAAEKHLGKIAEVIQRGCQVLGYSHEPLPRCAPDCDAQAHCQFGCPTDAKRSTNVSYVPLALQSNAKLITGARVTRVLVEKGRASGVQAESGVHGGIRRLRVRAPIVVISCGSLLTPLLLMRSGLCTRSKYLGRNLSLHPSSAVLALFDQEIKGWEGIPQGYAITQFVPQGLVLEGGFVSLAMAPIMIPFEGKAFMHLMDSYDRLASFGFMIQDTSRGRVFRGPGGLPMVVYNLNPADLQKIKLGKEILSRVFLAAGAKQVYTGIPGVAPLKSQLDLARFCLAKFSPQQFELAAFHPLGTARMGTSPKNSVIAHDHETHEVPNLFVVDGSSVPTSLGVNPQITIMALATRAAEFIGQKIP